jgi:hypothetical protein
MQGAWRDRVGPVRRNSTVDVLLNVLPGTPIITATAAARMLGRSFKSVNKALPVLVKADVLRQTTVGRRNRAFESSEVVDAFTAFERQLASPEGNTLTSRPARPVPARRQGEGA